MKALSRNNGAPGNCLVRGEMDENKDGGPWIPRRIPLFCLIPHPSDVNLFVHFFHDSHDKLGRKRKRVESWLDLSNVSAYGRKEMDFLAHLGGRNTDVR